MQVRELPAYRRAATIPFTAA